MYTGCTGRIGTNMAVELLKRGYTVRGIVMPGDPKTEKIKDLDIDSVNCDLRDTDGLLEATKGVDAVMHLGASMGKMPSCKHHAIEVIERLYPFAVSRVFAPGSVVFQYRVP